METFSSSILMSCLRPSPPSWFPETSNIVIVLFIYLIGRVVIIKMKHTTLSEQSQNSKYKTWKEAYSITLTHIYMTVHFPGLLQTLRYKTKMAGSKIYISGNQNKIISILVLHSLVYFN